MANNIAVGNNLLEYKIIPGDNKFTLQTPINNVIFKY